MPKKFKLFIDSSALISGLNSPTGGAGIIISAFLAGEFFIYIIFQRAIPFFAKPCRQIAFPAISATEDDERMLCKID